MSIFANDTASGTISFIVQNITTSGRSIKIFNTLIPSGGTLDLMKIPGIAEEDIRASLIKGDLKNKINNKQVKVITSPEIISSTLSADMLNILGLATTIRPAPIVPGTVKSLTNNAATSLFLIDLSQTFNYPSTTPDLSFGCKIFFAVECSDGTDVQLREGDINAAAVMKGGTITTAQAQNATGALTGGSLATNFTWLTSGTTATLQVTPVSSLTPTSLYIHYFLLHATHRAPAYTHL